MARAAVLLLLVPLLAGCAGDRPEEEGPEPHSGAFAGQPCVGFAAFPNGREPHVVLRTNHGNLELALYYEAVPVTVANFLDLARRGAYNGTTFHNITLGYFMQGGDPRSGGHTISPFTIQDEFHHVLRHSKRGIVSMANFGQPDTGSTEFFITFRDAPWLDDRNAVFGEVVKGFDVLDRIEARAASPSGRPLGPVTILGVDVVKLAGTGDPGQVGVWTPDDLQEIPLVGGQTGFLVVVENCSGVPQPLFVDVASRAQTWTLERGMDRVPMEAAQRRVILVYATLPPGPEGSIAEATVTVAGLISTTTVQLKAQRVAGTGTTPLQGDEVTAHYIGLTEDGRLFDTTREDVGLEPRVPKYRTFQRVDGGYEPFRFRPQAYPDCSPKCVILGLAELALGTPEGTTRVARVPPETGYGATCTEAELEADACLAGLTTLFQLDLAKLH